MSTILVVANETLGGAKLLETIQQKAGPDDRVVVCVPRNRPREGFVIYDDAVYDAAQVRIDLARQFLRERGVNAVGDVGDPDPYTATMDAVAEWRPDEIIISTFPATSSGWMRRDLIERISDATGLARHARRHRRRHGGPPLRRHARRREPHRLRRQLMAHLRSKKGDGRARAPVHRLRAPGGRRRDRGPGRARAPRAGARPHALRGHGRRGHDRRPRSLHGDDERAAVLPRRRHRDLDAPGDPLGLDARRPDRARAPRDPQARRARRGAAPRWRPEHGSREHRPRARARRPSRAAAGQPAARASSPSCSGCCFSSSARSWSSAPSSRPTSSSGSCTGAAPPHWFPINGNDLPKAVAGVNTAILLSSSITMHWAADRASRTATASR